MRISTIEWFALTLLGIIVCLVLVFDTVINIAPKEKNINLYMTGCDAVAFIPVGEVNIPEIKSEPSEISSFVTLKSQKGITV